MSLDQCIILVGGAGTRLQQLTQDCPKPLLPVNGRPFLDILLGELKRFGFRRIILSAGYLADQVTTYAARAASKFDLEIVVETEKKALGTAGALNKVLKFADDLFLLINGDSLFDFNPLDLIEVLATHGNAALAMALRRLDNAARFGVVDFDGLNITGFKAKGDGSGGLVNGGVYLVDRRRLGELPSEGSLEKDVMPRLATTGKLCGRVYEGFFLDIGVPTDYAAAGHLVPQALRRPAVFFDRDGVLNIDHGYVGSKARFEWTSTAIRAIKYVNDRGWFAFLVTNQAGVARGFFSENDVIALHYHMQCEMRAFGAHLDDIRFCPYHPDGTVSGFNIASNWRKPAPGMIIDLLNCHPVRSGASFLVGDKQTDLVAAKNAGIRGVMFDGQDLLQTIKIGIDYSELLGEKNPKIKDK